MCLYHLQKSLRIAINHLLRDRSHGADDSLVEQNVPLDGFESRITSSPYPGILYQSRLRSRDEAVADDAASKVSRWMWLCVEISATRDNVGGVEG